MTIRFRAKNLNLTDGSKEAITNKLELISNMFNQDTIFDVYLLKRDKDYKCKIKVQKGKDFVRSEETGRTLEFSVDNAITTLKKRVRKVKSMKITKKRGNSAISIKTINENLEEEVFEEELLDMKIERRKYVNLDEISEEEAILALEALNHSFYIFKNRDLNKKVCVVYRRNVGYGLIETE